jgi:putative spermidine/putrescine transport system substrate-binding protein
MKRQILVVLGLMAVLPLALAVPAQAGGGGGGGKVSILSWGGYAEDGSTDKDVDWVTPFEKETGCKASTKTFGTSDEAFQLFSTGKYDVVSASGDSSLRSVANGDAAVLNVSKLENYDDIAPFLKEQQNNSVEGKVYGVPHGWGANLLMFNSDEVSPAPESWGAVFDSDSPYSGSVTAYDSPIYIADAALYLSNTQPDLGITNPYALDQQQFDAAVDLLKDQKGIIGEYWSDYLKEQEAFTKGSSVLGTTWQVTANLVKGDDASPPVEAILPAEGSTAWSDNWMIHADSKNKKCAYEWLNWITSPDVQAEESEWYGEAPANLKACDLTSDPEHCTVYGANDPTFYENLAYWTTPTAKCLDGRDVKCVPYKDWAAAWDEIKGS